MTDLRQSILAALRDFDSYPLPEAATRLFATLGYKSDRVLPISTVGDFCREWDGDRILTTREREMLDQLSALHLLFQLTDTELTMQRDLLDQGNAVDGTRIHSYIFFAAELPPGAPYTRTLLAGIARAINKSLAMPALVLFRHGFLRGRDVKRWRIAPPGLWLLYVPWHFPRQDDPSIASASEKATSEFRKRYPVVYAHLHSHKEALAVRDRSETGIRYEWYALARPRYENHGAFLEPKIVIPCIEKSVAFAVDRAGFFSNDKTSIIASDAPESLCAVLNSRLRWWYATEHYPTKQGGFVEFKPTFMADFPIPDIKETGERLTWFTHALGLPYGGDQRQARDPLMRDYYEQILNALVYELYLPEELHTVGLRFFDLVEAAGLPKIAADPGRGGTRPSSGGTTSTSSDSLAALRRKFEELYAPNHPLRAALQKLHTLEPIRMIEGKA